MGQRQKEIEQVRMETKKTLIITCDKILFINGRFRMTFDTPIPTFEYIVINGVEYKNTTPRKVGTILDGEETDLL